MKGVNTVMASFAKGAIIPHMSVARKAHACPRQDVSEPVIDFKLEMVAKIKKKSAPNMKFSTDHSLLQA
jgi:hypothetical protein